MAMASPIVQYPAPTIQFSAYFARGTGHDEHGGTYSERSDDWVENMMRLNLKMDTARKILAAANR